MSLKPLAIFLAIFFCLLQAGCKSAQSPPSMQKDPVAYVHYLQTSTDPQAIAIRTQIENGPADLAKAKAAALQAGLVLDPAKLQRPLPPDGQNAAPLYAKLADMLHDKPLGLPMYAEPLDASHTYTPEQIAAVQKIYDSRPEVWALIHQTADTPQFVIARSWTNPTEPSTMRFGSIREAERLLCTETYLLARQGKYSAAVKNQARDFQIARHAASDLTLLSYLAWGACDALALRGMHDILILSGPNAEVAAQVKQAVEGGRPNFTFRSALSHEPAQISWAWSVAKASLGKNRMADVIANIQGSNQPLDNSVKPSGTDKQFASDWVDASEAISLNRMRSLAVAADLPLAARRIAFASASGIAETPPTVLTLIRSFSGAEMSSFADIPAHIQARETVLLAGAAAMGAWTKGGGFPAALPGKFTDPFTGKPLGYRREGTNGFVVYSAGPDGTFDGGKPGDKTQGQILFRYPAVPVP